MDNDIFDDEDELPSCSINLLPQYRNSVRAEHMFIDSIGCGLVDRSKSEIGKPKTIKDNEEKLEYYEFFFNNNELQNEFAEWMIQEIGQKKFDLYCSIIVDQWSDGKSKRLKNKDLKALKKSIHNYLLETNNSSNLKIFSKNILFNKDSANVVFTTNDINRILNINGGMFEKALYEWMNQHSDGLRFGTNDVYFRRGINSKFQSNGEYYENDYINSYSLSATIGEQFSQTGKSARSLIHGEYGLFHKRILFFTPFIKGMSLEQLELGIIPHTQALYYTYQDEIDSIKEYILDNKSSK